MTPISVRTEGLGRNFGSLQAVVDLDLEIEAGTIFGLLGPNGAGKTTTIRLLLGLLRPTRGRAEVLGIDPAADSQQIRYESGALLEHHGLYERLTAEQNLEFFCRIWGMDGKDRRHRVQELLVSFGLWPRRSDRVGDWSRGMKQRLAVARALAHRPALVFLDEPTAGLDPVAARSLREGLSRLAAEDGTTVVLSTHHLGEAEELCSRVAILRAGRAIAQGPPRDLLRGSRDQRLRISGHGWNQDSLEVLRSRDEVVEVHERPGGLGLRLEAGTKAEEVVAELVRGGASVTEVRNTGDRLEEVFLELMEEAL